jgi:ABC-type tungstate transport system permease subunit
MAHKFTDWMVWKNGGQKVIEEFEVGGARLYTVAPVSTELDSRE